MSASRYLCLLVSCLGLYGCASSGSTAPSGKGGKKGGGDVPVTVAKVGRRNVPINIQVIGNVEAYSTIAVKAQVGGILTKVSFQEGDYVKNDDLLFTIDPRPLKAMLDQQEATLAKNRAQLRQAEVNIPANAGLGTNAAKDIALFSIQLDEMRKQYARKMYLNAEGITAAKDVDVARAAYERVQVMLAAKRKKVKEALDAIQEERHLATELQQSIRSQLAAGGQLPM